MLKVLLVPVLGVLGVLEVLEVPMVPSPAAMAPSFPRWGGKGASQIGEADAQRGMRDSIELRFRSDEMKCPMDVSVVRAG